MITKQEWKVILEKEGISDFLMARSYEEDPDTGIGIYQTCNEYFGTIFRIFPPAYLGENVENNISTFFNLEFPVDSVIQFFTFSSRNVSSYTKMYENLHTNKENNTFKEAHVKNKIVLDEMVKTKMGWLKKFSNESIFQKHNLELYLRDYVTLVTVMVPRLNEHNEEYSNRELINIFSRAKEGVRNFSPINYPQSEYVKLLGEIFNPAKPLWSPQADSKTMINSQIGSSTSAIQLLNNGAISFGNLKEDTEGNVVVDSQIKENKSLTSKLFLSPILKMFGVNTNKVGKDVEKINASWYANMLTTKMYPEEMDISTYSDLIMDYFGMKAEPMLPLPYFSSLTVKIEEKEKLSKSVENTAKWNLYQLKAIKKIVNFVPQLKDKALEAQDVISLIKKDGEIPLRAQWSMCIFGESESELEKYTTRTIKAFMNQNWHLQKEVLIQLPVMLFSLPLQFDEQYYKWSKRFNTLFKSNNAAICPLANDPKGFSAPMLMYVGRNGQVQGIDLFDSHATNKNFITVAPTGSGKSYLMGDLFLQYLAGGTKIRVIDSGESYLSLCESVGGKYIRFDEKSNPCLNFFTHIVTDQYGNITQDQIEAYVPVVGMMAKQNLDTLGENAQDDMHKAVIAAYVSKAIKRAYEMEGNKAGMREVLIALEQEFKTQVEKNNQSETDEKLRDLIKALYPYGDPDGEHFSYYNGENNISFEEDDFVVMEMMDLEAKGNIKNVVLLSLINLINTEFYFGKHQKRKMLAIDEAWSLISNPIVGGIVESFYRKIRKFNGSIGIITQSIEDFYKNKSVEVIYENAFFKFFLAQDQEAIEKAIQEKKVIFDGFTLKLIKALKTEHGKYSDLMCKTSKGQLFIGKLIADKVLHWMLTNQDNDKLFIDEIMRKFALKRHEACIVIGKSEMQNTSIEEEVMRIKEVPAYEQEAQTDLLKMI